MVVALVVTVPFEAWLYVGVEVVEVELVVLTGAAELDVEVMATDAGLVGATVLVGAAVATSEVSAPVRE